MFKITASAALNAVFIASGIIWLSILPRCKINSCSISPFKTANLKLPFQYLVFFGLMVYKRLIWRFANGFFTNLCLLLWCFTSGLKKTINWIIKKVSPFKMQKFWPHFVSFQSIQIHHICLLGSVCRRLNGQKLNLLLDSWFHTFLAQHQNFD